MTDTAAAPPRATETDLEPGAVLEARNLDVGYGDLAAARGINIALHPGEVIALLGPNGAGKTTLLLTLIGVLKPLVGDVLWLGKPTRSPLHVRARQGLAFVPEDRGVVSGLSAQDNLKVGNARVQMAVDAFPELANLMRRKGGLLSGGEQQMLTIGRAIGRKPKVILVDELSQGLAPIVAERLARVLRAAADQGTAVLVVDQSVRRSLAIADRFYFLKSGSVTLSGASRDYAHRQEELEQLFISEAVRQRE